MSTPHRRPALHNAMWPGLVGKGPDSEPPIDLDTMLNLTAAAEVDGVRFDGVDLFLSLPHTDIDSSDDELKSLAEKLRAKGLAIGSLVAPVWPATGGGSAMGSEEERGRFLTQVKKACAIGRKLHELGIRKSGVVRIDSATGVDEWAEGSGREHKENCARLFAKPATLPKALASASPLKARSAGAACTAGAAMSSYSNRWACPGR